MKKRSSGELKKEIKELERDLSSYANQPGHRMPSTRREFLTSGLMAAATSMFPTSILSLLSQSAWAQDLGCESSNDLPAYVNLQLAGGPALFAQHVAHGNNGSAFANYAILGMGSGPQIGEYFKNKAPFYEPSPAGPGSGFLLGMQSRMGAEIFKDIIGGPAVGTPGKSVFIAVACKSIDDVLTNKHDLAGMLSKAGLGGGILPYLLVETSNASPVPVDLGSNRFKPAVYSAPTYLSAQSRDAIEASLGFKGALLTNLGPKENSFELQNQLMTAINNLTRFQAQQLISQPNSSESRKLAYQLSQCATAKSQKVMQSQTTIDLNITNDTTMKAIWAENYTVGGFSADFKNSVSSMIGTSVVATLRGLSPACTAVIGGFDYHAGSSQSPNRKASDDKDYYAGQVVANILMTARALNKKVFLYISSDGSVSTPLSSSNPVDILWVGDYAERGMNYIIAYDPSGTIEAKGYVSQSYRDAAFQLNHFIVASNTDLVVGTVNPIGSAENQDLAAAAVFANYLSFAKREDLMRTNNLTVARQKLEDAMPSGETNLFNYFSRIVGA